MRGWSPTEDGCRGGSLWSRESIWPFWELGLPAVPLFWLGKMRRLHCGPRKGSPLSIEAEENRHMDMPSLEQAGQRKGIAWKVPWSTGSLGRDPTNAGTVRGESHRCMRGWESSLFKGRQGAKTRWQPEGLQSVNHICHGFEPFAFRLSRTTASRQIHCSEFCASVKPVDETAMGQAQVGKCNGWMRWCALMSRPTRVHQVPADIAASLQLNWASQHCALHFAHSGDALASAKSKDAMRTSFWSGSGV